MKMFIFIWEVSIVFGAIIGDIVGSIYEFDNIKTKSFELFSSNSRFTDDTVLTVATIDALLNEIPFVAAYKKWFNKYPNAGYGGSFMEWAKSGGSEPYNSWGNGSAMRVSPVGSYFKTLEEVLAKAKQSAEVTHNHPEGIKGAQAVASSVFFAKTGKAKSEIKEFVKENFNYNLDEPIPGIRTWYKFDVSCQGSVPQAITAFLESTDFEDAIRNAVSIGGDSDTIACITGSIAEAYYKDIPEKIKKEALGRLDSEMQTLIKSFYRFIG